MQRSGYLIVLIFILGGFAEFLWFYCASCVEDIVNRTRERRETKGEI